MIKTFYRGYEQLSDQDFFGIDDEDVDSMSFMDRINLYTKIGNFVNINFTEKEKKLLSQKLSTLKHLKKF